MKALVSGAGNFVTMPFTICMSCMCRTKMHYPWKLAFILFIITLSQGEADSPARLSPVVIPGGSNGADEVLAARREAIKEEITPILNDLVYQPPYTCACGGPGQWSRI